jgi:hypothetical protein
MPVDSSEWRRSVRPAPTPDVRRRTCLGTTLESPTSSTIHRVVSTSPSRRPTRARPWLQLRTGGATRTATSHRVPCAASAGGTDRASWSSYVSSPRTPSLWRGYPPDGTFPGVPPGKDPHRCRLTSRDPAALALIDARSNSPAFVDFRRARPDGRSAALARRACNA